MLRDFGGGWPLTRPLDHPAKSNQPPPASRPRTCPTRQTNACRPDSSKDSRGVGEPFSAPRLAFAYLLAVMERPTRFENHRWVGDKRNQVAHDLDACTDEDAINELLAAETYLAFGPDTL